VKQLLIFLIPAAIWGHDLYLKPAKMIVAGGEKSVVEYHNGDAFPKSQATVVIERLRDAKRIAASGEAPFENIHDEGTTTVATFAAPATGHFYLVSRTIPNYIEIDAGEFEEYLSHEGLGWVVEYRKANGESQKAGREIYSKYVKSLLVAGSGDGSFAKPAGLTLEFIPLDDPYGAVIGGNIRVQLLYRGKAAAGHEVELESVTEGKPSRIILGKTDGQGMITAPIPSPGFYKLHAIVMERLTDRTKADWESCWATLTFGTRR
jgi:uncharacterized GH25 family protein